MDSMRGTGGHCGTYKSAADARRNLLLHIRRYDLGTLIVVTFKHVTTPDLVGLTDKIYRFGLKSVVPNRRAKAEKVQDRLALGSELTSVALTPPP
jgi:hypothetical protein